MLKITHEIDKSETRFDSKTGERLPTEYTHFLHIEEDGYVDRWAVLPSSGKAQELANLFCAAPKMLSILKMIQEEMAETHAILVSSAAINDVLKDMERVTECPE